MKRLIKLEGRYNLALEEVPIPEPGRGEVRIKAVRSLISRGSEIGARYTREHAVSPEIMGYSLAGHVDAVGEGVTEYAVGDRVVALAPHAEYVVCAVAPATVSAPSLVTRMLPALTFDQAPYLPLAAGAVTWVDIEDIQKMDTVVIVGQGLVGSLMLQVMQANGRGRLIVVDAVGSRCALAAALGVAAVINASEEDPVEVVMGRTNRVGADIVVYAVGGPAGPAAFAQCLDMLAPGGLLHLIGLYEDQPLLLPSGKIQRRRLLGGYYGQSVGPTQTRRAMELLASGAIRTDRMTTHRFPYMDTPEAFALLYHRPSDAFGVLLDWET